ncbi:hypothetical protein [Streptomyces sp. NPDC001978]|uniref:hypothetical protein n=1 Tax=Streptomyces sp. NPDC001978 TaxID=3364627 RepID=UPI0036C1C951
MPTFGLVAKKELQLDTSPGEALERAQEAVTALSGTVTGSDPASGCINAKVPSSAWSWGERLTIVVQPHAPAGSLVNIKSRSWMPFNVFNFGKNRRNVEFISRSLA